MYKMKYIFGQTVKYQGKICKIKGIRFTAGGTLYKLSGTYKWIKEEEITK